MLALSSGNAALYGVQTWTFTDSRILAVHSYRFNWGVALSDPIVAGSIVATNGSLIAALDFSGANCVAMFAASKTTCRGFASLYDLTARVELWRNSVGLAWADDPAVIMVL
jgi:hypothetical protein